MMNKTQTGTALVGLTVNVYRNPITNQKFEGAAKVKKVLSVNDETNLALCRVKFKQNNSVAERLIRLRREVKG